MAASKKANSKAGTSLAKWDEELARRANIQKGMEKNTGLEGANFISLRGGVMMYKDKPIPGNKLNVIVLDAIMENKYFPNKFDPAAKESPACYAFGRDEDTMAPHKNAEAPQHSACAGCPLNEWESSDTGRGKACKNGRRLALITEGDLKNIEDAEVAYIAVPVTSVRGWAQYVRSVGEQVNRPTMGVVTELSVVPDQDTQFKLQYKFVGKIEDRATDFDVEALMQKADEVAGKIDFPYPKNAPKSERAGKGAGAAQGGAKHGRRVQAAPAPTKGRTVVQKPAKPAAKAPAKKAPAKRR